MFSAGEDRADREERKASEEHREDTAAVKVSEHVDDLGGVHDQEPGRLHPEASSPVKDADQVQHQHSSDQKPSAHECEFAQCHDAPADPLSERQHPGTISPSFCLPSAKGASEFAVPLPELPKSN